MLRPAGMPPTEAVVVGDVVDFEDDEHAAPTKPSVIASDRPLTALNLFFCTQSLLMLACVYLASEMVIILTPLSVP